MPRCLRVCLVDSTLRGPVRWQQWRVHTRQQHAAARLAPSFTAAFAAAAAVLTAALALVTATAAAAASVAAAVVAAAAATAAAAGCIKMPQCAP